MAREMEVLRVPLEPVAWVLLLFISVLLVDEVPY
jgi:hypothetical protein